MHTHLLEHAATIITSPQVLVNVISKRVRQLMNGHRALVEVLPRMGLADIALSEVIQGKLTCQPATDSVPEVAFRAVGKLTGFTPERKAA